MSVINWDVVRHGGYHATHPLRCGERTYSSETVERGLTPQYALVYLSAGSAMYSDPQHPDVVLQPGDAFQRRPEEPHRIVFAPGSHTWYVALPAEVFHLMKATNVASIHQPRLRVGLQHWIAQRFSRLVRELKSCPAQQLMAVLSRMQQFVVELHLQARAREVSPGAARRIETGCALLSANLDQKIDMPGIAKKVGLSYPNFRKLFCILTGIPPGEYRIRRRIERAQELLLQGCSATEVSEMLGYADLFTFSAQFKKFCGQSPRTFSREARAQ